VKQALITIIGIIIASAIGANYVPSPHRSYDPEAYYQSTLRDSEPDFRAIYDSYNKSVITSEQGSDKSAKPYPSSQRPYRPDNERQFLWFWTVEGSTPPRGVMQPYDSQFNKLGYTITSDGYYKWELNSSEKYLISIANSTLFPRSQTPIDPYPTIGTSLGTHLTYIIKLPNERKAFRITYGSMERWWSCMGKTKPDDGTTEKPLYYHTVSFGEDPFNGGSVVGLAGKSGVVDSTNPVLIVRIEVCDIDSQGRLSHKWQNSSLEELYIN
jgi:hypothetical protein